MNTDNFSKLPPELQERINNIVNQAAQQQAAAVVPAAPQGMELSMDGSQYIPQKQPQQAPVPQPSLMDHIVALRQEVNQLSNQVAAIGQVTEAVGNAVGELNQMFHHQTQPTNFSTGFQTQAQVEDDEY